MTRPKASFDDHATALRMKEVIAKVVRSEMSRQRPPARYGKVHSFSRLNSTVQVLFPGDQEPIRARAPLSVQPTRSIELHGFDAADIVRVAGPPGNRWVTEVVSGPTFQSDSRLESPVLTGGSSVDKQMAKHFALGTSQLPSVGQSWYFGRWTNSSSLSANGLAYFEIVVQQTLVAKVIKKYNIAVRASDTLDQWRKCAPTFDSGPWSGENFDLEIRVGADYVEFRVRRIASISGGLTPGGYDFSGWFFGEGWQQDPGAPEAIDAGGEPSRAHGTDSADGKGPFLSPHASLPVAGQFLLSGGGAVSYTSGGVLRWTARFLVIGTGRSPLIPGGFLQIPVPVGGVSIPVYGNASVTSVTTQAGGIPLGNYQALYYDLPWGAGSGDFSENRFRIVDQSSANSIQGVPSHWVLIAVHNNDSMVKQVRIGTGITVPIKQTVTLNSPFVAHGSGTHTPGFVRADDRVFLEGTMRNDGGSATSGGAVAFNLPAGFRPGSTCTFINLAVNSLQFVRIDVQANGNVILQAGVNAGGIVALDGISFRAEV